MLIDSHAHLNFIAFNDDLDEVIKRTLESGMFVINVGSKYDNSKKAIEIAKEYSGMYATIGLHPTHLRHEFFKIKKDPVEEAESVVEENTFDNEKYKQLFLDAPKGKVVAIGEIGLDYYYKPKTTAKKQAFKEMQKKLFLEQLELAKDLNLPVIFHVRMAHQDMIEILKNYSLQTTHYKLSGVIHCFTGTWQEAKTYLDMGLYLGINGIMYKFDLTEVIKNAPMDKLLVETDCPYLTPGEEGDKRNEPIFVKHIAKKIAETRGISFEEVASATTQNAKKLFGI